MYPFNHLGIYPFVRWYLRVCMCVCLYTAYIYDTIRYYTVYTCDDKASAKTCIVARWRGSPWVLFDFCNPKRPVESYLFWLSVTRCVCTSRFLLLPSPPHCTSLVLRLLLFPLIKRPQTEANLARRCDAIAQKGINAEKLSWISSSLEQSFFK